MIAGEIENSSLGSDMHHGFKHSGFRFEPIRKAADHFGEVGVMGDPRFGIDLPFLDQADDAAEIWGQGIATGQQGHFPTMHQRMTKGHLRRGDAHKNQPPGEAHKSESIGHRLVAAGRIDDDGWQVAIGELFVAFCL